MADLPQVRFVTARVPYLYGLTALPFCAVGCLELAWAAGWLSWLPHTTVLRGETYEVAADLVALVVAYCIRRRYRALYGRVKLRGRARSMLEFSASCVGYVAMTLVTRRIGAGPDLGALFVSACCLRVACRERPYRSHYAILAGGAAALSGVRLLGLPKPTLWMIYNAACICGMAIAGVGDHRLLVRTMLPLSQHEDDHPL